MDAGAADGGFDAALPWDAGPDGSAAPPTAVLEIHARDIWGQALPEDEATLTITRDAVEVPTSGWPVIRVPLYEAGSYTVALEAEGHWPLEVVATFDGSDRDDALRVTVGASASGQGLSVAHGQQDFGSATLPAHAVFLGLRHKYFSAQGRPARRGNRLELFTSGEAAWQSVHDEILAASESVHMATWWWESDFELVRPLESHLTSTLEERQANTILGTLDRSAASTKRILVGQFLSQDGVLDWSTVSSDVRDRGATPDDGFEFMGQANPTRGVFEFMVRPSTSATTSRSSWTRAGGPSRRRPRSSRRSPRAPST